VRSVRAGALLVAGDAEGAYAMAAKVVPRLPRGLRGGPLCTMARAALELGRADEAARLLDRARAADPDEPRLAYVVPV
jgi:predicted Zn-dependent protease